MDEQTTQAEVADDTAAVRAALPPRFKWLLAATFAGAFLFLLVTIGYVHLGHIASRRLEAQMLAQGYAQRIQERVQTALVSTYVLANTVKQSRGDLRNFNDVAGELLSLFPGVSALQLAPDGVIQEIYPLKGNEAAIGHDLLQDRKRNRDAVVAVTTGQLTLAGPFNLIQGGLGAVGRLPVFLTNEQGERYFWGFAIALIRIQSLIESVGLPALTKSGYQYQLWRTHPETEKREVFASSGDKPLDDPVEYVITIFNGHWILSLSPESGWVTIHDYLEIFGLALLGALIVTLLQHIGLRVLLRER
ncbi:MAG TPA: CHASE domain-containing protein [Rhodocyclaceae bacterium]